MLRSALLAAGCLIGGTAAASAACLVDRVAPDEALLRCENGVRGRLLADGFGDVSGHIGSDRVRLRSDGFGGTQGRIGRRPVSTYDGGFGDVEITEDRRAALCRRDGFGGLDCK